MDDLCVKQKPWSFKKASTAHCLPGNEKKKLCRRIPCNFLHPKSSFTLSLSWDLYWRFFFKYICTNCKKSERSLKESSKESTLPQDHEHDQVKSKPKVLDLCATLGTEPKNVQLSRGSLVRSLIGKFCWNAKEFILEFFFSFLFWKLRMWDQESNLEFLK